MVTYAAGETRDPRRTIPKALVIGPLVVTACYIALNAAYLRLLPLERVIASTRVAADAAQAMAGPRGAAAISALVILSAVGVLNGVILAGPRTYFAMAEDGLAFRGLGAVDRRFHTPHRAIAAQAAWSWRREGYKPVWPVWGYPVVPVVFGAAALVVAATQIAADPRKAGAGLLFVVLGLPVYHLWIRRPHARH